MTTPTPLPFTGDPGAAARQATLPSTASRFRFSRLARNPLALVPLLFLLIVVIAAVAAPLLAPHNPTTASVTGVLSGPSAAHPLGTDGAGRDVLSRLLYAARYSLAGAIVALATALLIGVTSGLLAGYFRRWTDTVFSSAASLLMALPAIIVLLAAQAVVGPSLWISMLIFGVMLSPAFFRLVYALVTAVRDELYVDAARVSGLSDARIIRRHILTVIRAPLIIQGAIVGGVALAVQSGLEFLGLGDTSIPTWGSMLNDAFANIYRTPLLIVWPTCAIGFTLLALTLLANSLRDELQRSPAPAAPRKRPATSISPPPAPAADVITHEPQLPPDADIILRVQNLSVGYPTPGGGLKRVVEDVSLTVARGEVHGLVGESGSGKTQTAWSILRLLPPGGQIVAGAVHFEGVNLSALGQRQMSTVRGKRIAYIPQEPMSNLDPAFSIGSQLVEPMRVCLGLSKAEARQRALELLAKVGIPHPQRTFGAYPHQVSGGMAQRVLIAGAISCQPDLLIADEPTTALDVTVQAEICDLLRDLQAEMRMGLILVTHDFGVVADLCDRVSVMRHGRIVETGPTRALFADPQHPYTRELLGAVMHDSAPRGPLAAVNAGPVPAGNGTAADPAPGRAPACAPLLQVSGVVVEYPGRGFRDKPFRAIHDICLDVREGECVGLVGESGSGKTTLGRAVLGLAPVSAGRVLYHGADIARLGRRERRRLGDQIQVVFQDPYTSLNPSLTVEKILAEPLMVKNISKREASRRIARLFDLVQLPKDSGSRLPREFSGGQRQRIAIARALALEPRLIVCDEPVSALDLSTQAKVLELFRDIQQQTGVAYLFVSHDLEVVRHISHRVAVMYRGEIVELGDGDAVTGSPQHPYTQRLFLASPVADPDAQTQRREQRRRLKFTRQEENEAVA